MATKESCESTFVMAQRRNSCVQVQVPRKDITCPVCLEVFEDPKSLPKCAHIFCTTCLESILTARKGKTCFDCPVCRTKTNIPREGIDGFVSALTMKLLVEGNPGLKQMKTLKANLAECEKRVKKSKIQLKDLEKTCKDFEAAQKNIDKLESDMTERANKMIKMIESHCTKTCCFLDEARQKNTKSMNQMQELKEELAKNIEETQTYVDTVKAVASSNDCEKIESKAEELMTQFRGMDISSSRCLSVSEKPVQVKHVIKSPTLNASALCEMLGSVEIMKLQRPATAVRNHETKR